MNDHVTNKFVFVKKVFIITIVQHVLRQLKNLKIVQFS